MSDLFERLECDGFAGTGRLLSDAACDEIVATWNDHARFRSHVVMARHGFGQGEYRYFTDPMPERVTQLREDWYGALAPSANRWAQRLGIATKFEATHREFRARCHEAGQRRPTPLLLRYREGDYNRLHQDLYGTIYFPFQLVILLSQPGAAFDGGEFILAEQRARMQTRAEVVPLGKGEGVVFATRERAVPSPRGHSRAMLRHGVSRIRSGERFTLGVVFHDAS